MLEILLSSFWLLCFGGLKGLTWPVLKSEIVIFAYTFFSYIHIKQEILAWDMHVSYTPCRDTAISPQGGISLSSTPTPPYCVCANVILPYQTTFLWQQQKKVQLNKLPQTAIMFKIIDGTILFNNAKIQIHALGSICVRRDSI